MEAILNTKANGVAGVTMESHKGHNSVMRFTAMVSEVNLMGSNPKEWWVDTGAASYISSNHKMLTNFQAAIDGEQLLMGNSLTTKVKGQGKSGPKNDFGKRVETNQYLVCAIHS